MKFRLAVLAILVVSLFQVGDMARAQTAPRDRINGGFFEFGGMDADSTASYIAEQAALGVDTILTTGTVACKQSPFASPLAFDQQYVWLDANIPTLLPVLLSQAQAHGMKVYLGLVNSEACPDQSGDAAESGALVSYLTTYYDSLALAGWYIPNESYIQDAAWFAGEVQYFSGVVNAIRQRSTLPILESPYLVSYSPALLSEGGPAAAASTAKAFLTATGIDVLVYEDGAGGRLAGGAIGWDTFPTIGDYFSAISAAVGPEHLWIVHEIFEDTFGIGGGSGSESITRLNQQIAMVPDALIGKRLTWTAQNWMSAVSPVRNADSQRLLAGYKATHGMGGTLVKPGEILWLVPTSSPQPYLSPTLTDGVIGDPFTPNSKDWIGTLGAVAFVVDLWGTYAVDWVSIQAAKQHAGGIEIPQQIVIFGSVDGAYWNYLTTRTFSAADGFDGEMALGNAQPLNASVRFLWIYMVNSASTRIGEIEVVAR